MNRIRTTALAALAAATFSAPARASVPHTVTEGETLWSIASADGLTPAALAAANGLSQDAHVVLGSTIQVPAPGTPAALGQGAPPVAGGYTVQPGDTLSGIAAAAGVSAGQIAWMNGLDAGAPLLAGTALKLPTEAAAATPQAVPERTPAAAPYASAGLSSSSEIAQVAAAEGVPGSLAAAIAWQESGFNNGVVSAANARGVMQ